MTDRTRPDVNLTIAEEDGSVATWECASIAVLMDIRRELRRLNAAIYCRNFVGMPRHLARIARNTEKPPKNRAEKKR